MAKFQAVDIFYTLGEGESVVRSIISHFFRFLFTIEEDKNSKYDDPYKRGLQHEPWHMKAKGNYFKLSDRACGD